ncbi:MAG TPA: hypothetical protein VF310_00060 [Vicinamibacteria bacterium]
MIVLDRWQRAGLLAAGAGLLAVVAGLIFSPGRTWPALLVGNVYLLSLALAGALFIAIHYLAGAGWWVVVRRVAEAMMAGLPVVALLLLALFFGRHALYPWAGAAGGEHAPLAGGKAAWLSTPFVFARMAVVLLAWVLLARALRRASLRQDQDADLGHHRRLVHVSAAFVVVFALSFSLAGVDWLMSLDPHWYSTMYAVYLFAGLLVSGIAVLTVIVLLLRRAGPLAGVVTEEHLHDLGRLVFAFSTFWAYIWLSQYLLIWYGNLPEEVTHYVRRTRGGWSVLFFLNLALNWAVPFLVLMPRAAKRHPRVLGAVCLVVLLGHWLDLYLLVGPERLASPALGPLELLVAAGYTGLFLALTARALGQAPLLPRNDPYLAESLGR